MAGIYIHVPFCKTRCIYCDFYTRTDLKPRKEYVEAICKEIALRKDYIRGEEIDTIYFGGGTPSQLSYEDFDRIFESINKDFIVNRDAEITLEANPDDLNIKYIRDLCKLPFNRLSIGVQSFNDNELRFLNRRHSAEKAKEAVLDSQNAGFSNISIDLIYGLPNQTMDIWQKNLAQTLSLGIQHISSYHLIYEQGTRLYGLLEKESIRPVDEDLSVDMFSAMIDKLAEAGFQHYEISNFAQEGFISRHNSSYWLGKKYLGLGPAAHSFDGCNRAWNIPSIAKYIEKIKNNLLPLEIEVLDENTRYNDFILTGMRTMWGVDLRRLEEKFGENMKKYALANVQKYIDKGFVTNENNILKLTRDGIFISDGIMSDMMWID